MKKIIFLLFLTTHLAFAQVKPITFGLQLKFNPLDFAEDKRPILTKLSNELLKAVSNKFDSIAKTSCIDYKGIDYKGIDAKATDMTYLIQIDKRTDRVFKDGIWEDYNNLPMGKFLYIDNFKADTLDSWFAQVILHNPPKSKEGDFELLESDFPAIIKNNLFYVEMYLSFRFMPCERTLDYKLQKRHQKEVVFVTYPTITKDKNNKKHLQIIDNLFSNYFINTQITDEKNKNITDYFIFYPYNKDTKDIKPDVTIQLQLVQDKMGNYELKGEFKGEKLNLQMPGGEGMTTSIKFNKKRIDSGDYTEFIYKLGRFASSIHTYNVLL